jgi:hypothetical protein
LHDTGPLLLFYNSHLLTASYRLLPYPTFQIVMTTMTLLIICIFSRISFVTWWCQMKEIGFDLVYGMRYWRIGASTNWNHADSWKWVKTIDELLSDHTRLGKLKGKLRKLHLYLMTSNLREIKPFCISPVDIMILIFQMWRINQMRELIFISLLCKLEKLWRELGNPMLRRDL